MARRVCFSLVEQNQFFVVVIVLILLVGKPTMMYVKRKICSHCGSKIKPIEGKMYSKMEKFVSYVICFAG